MIGDYKNIGLSEQKYRTAKNKLQDWNFVTFKTTNRGTIAKLIDSRVFDINIQLTNEQNNDQITSQQRTDNEQATTNKNDNNEYDEDKYSKTSSHLYKKANKALNEIIEFQTRVRFEAENRELGHKIPLRYEDYPDYKVRISSIGTGATIKGEFKTARIAEEEGELWLSRARFEYLLEEAEEIVTNYALNIEEGA